MITQKTFGTEFDDLAPSTHTPDENPFATMMASFDAAAARLGLDPDLYTILRKPDRELHVALPTRLDDGTLAVFDGYRVQHNSGKGPYFGPLRLQAGLTLDELRALAGRDGTLEQVFGTLTKSEDPRIQAARLLSQENTR